MSSPIVSPPVAKAATLACPNCGGPVERRGFGHALTVVCPQCLSVIDTSNPQLQILQRIEAAQRRTPLIPLGTRGKLNGYPWDVIGFQTRQVSDEDSTYSWDEYLLFNPYKGFRYLTEYQGHWNFVTPMEWSPERYSGIRPSVGIDGKTYLHFAAAEAETVFVLGEFPWRVKCGERVVCDDFVNPPVMLSSETTEDEVTWSRGDYTPGSEIWKAFSLAGSPPRASGIFSNQPSPYRDAGSIWPMFIAMTALLIGLAIFFGSFSQDRKVFQQSYSFSTRNTTEASFVTPVFELGGRTSTVQVDINTDLDNNWAYFDMALVNQDTGQGYDFGHEVSYYSGSDSDGAWTEGDRSSSTLLPSVAPGHYYLRVEPEMDTDKSAKGVVNSVHYSITLRRDVPAWGWFWIAFLFLLIPAIVHTIRVRSFEGRRWMESDYGSRH